MSVPVDVATEPVCALCDVGSGVLEEFSVGLLIHRCCTPASWVESPRWGVVFIEPSARVGVVGRGKWPVTDGGVDQRDVRRLFLVEASPEETDTEAGSDALREVASMFPALVVTAPRSRTAKSGWYAVVVTSERGRDNRKSPCRHLVR